MSLPWVRLDSHIGSHDKILALLSDPSPRRWQAAFSYVCALGWSGDQGTDGLIPAAALPFIHGTKQTARLLVIDRGFGPLWREASHTTWEIVNYAERQELAVITAGKREAARISGQKGACVRHHPPGCWLGDRCSRE